MNSFTPDLFKRHEWQMVQLYRQARREYLWYLVNELNLTNREAGSRLGITSERVRQVVSKQQRMLGVRHVQ